MEENNNGIEFLKELFERNKGLKRNFGPFMAVVNDDSSITISSESGWKVTYPAFGETWAIIISWIEMWEEKDQNAISNFIKGVVFPCSIRLSDIDAEYVGSIVDAHEKLTKRRIEKETNEDEDEGTDGN